MSSKYIIDIKKPFKKMYNIGTTIEIPSIRDLFSLGTSVYEYPTGYGNGKIEVISSSSVYIISDDTATGGKYIFDSSGGFEIKYSGSIPITHLSPGSGLPRYSNDVYSISYFVIVATNHLPLKKWTVTGVLDRLFDLAEPIYMGERPRFRLQGVKADGTFEAGSQAEKFDKIPAPEFAFTKQTLRECLKQVGYIVHGEPRLTPKKDEAGTWYYEVSYDLYGGTEQWRSAHRRYIANTVAYTAEQFATALDSAPENLINKLKGYDGVTVEPYGGGAKSVRTDKMYVQITETNMVIATQRPIYTVEKLEYVEIGDDGTEISATDITPYLFESSVYNSQLSSYESQYPYSKAYGLMYTQGEKNITALNFKQEHPISEIFTQYAIVNIIREATGNNGFMPSDYARLCFRVTYTPIYNARVKQVKPNYTEYETGATQIYNQTSNLVESRAFGENLKGVIARMGNPEISRTYMFSRLSQLPRAGMKYDDDYYISAVYTEFYTPYIRCTVALTRDFNRISQYIGIPQYKRYSQVSQTMAVERNVVYEEYIVVGDKEEPDAMMLHRTEVDLLIQRTFTQEQDSPIDRVCAYGRSFGGETDGFNLVLLPVVASAYGNSIAFSWEYEDNYSAGATAVYREGIDSYAGVKGFFQNDYPYSDYYGRMYYYSFYLGSGPLPIMGDEEEKKEVLRNLPFRLPNANGVAEYASSFIDGVALVIRKDSREKLQINMQVHFVTNRKGLIIGSALASYSASVRNTKEGLAAKLYVLDKPIDKFTENLASVGIDLLDCPSCEVTISRDVVGPFSDPIYVQPKEKTFPAGGKAWVIATQPIKGDEEQVEDEKGNVTTVQKSEGGDLLLGMNMDFEEGDTFDAIYFTQKREVFPKTVWKDKV